MAILSNLNPIARTLSKTNLLFVKGRTSSSTDRNGKFGITTCRDACQSLPNFLDLTKIYIFWLPTFLALPLLRRNHGFFMNNIWCMHTHIIFNFILYNIQICEGTGVYRNKISFVWLLRGENNLYNINIIFISKNWSIQVPRVWRISRSWYEHKPSLFLMSNCLCLIWVFLTCMFKNKRSDPFYHILPVINWLPTQDNWRYKPINKSLHFKNHYITIHYLMRLLGYVMEWNIEVF